jgi:hypothetical protein
VSDPRVARINQLRRGWIKAKDAKPVTQRTVDFIERVVGVARECGYAVGVHGSLNRDLDLIAVPWTVEAVSADRLVATLCERVPMRERPGNPYPDGKVTTNPEPKPWGRWGWSLTGCPEHAYVDLSVAPRAGEPVPLLNGVLRESEAA